MSFAFGVSSAPLFFLLLKFRFLTLILIAFLVGTISCFVSKLSTVATTSFECFLGPFFVRGTYKEGIPFLFTQLIQSVFAFHKIDAQHDSTQTTTIQVVFITKQPRFVRDKHESWTCELVGPYTHGLIQTVCISR